MEGPRDVVYLHAPPRTPEEECALDILSLFLLSLCGKIDRSKFLIMAKDDRVQLLRKLAHSLDEEGLVRDYVDGAMFVVSAFARFDLMEGIE